MTKLLFDKMLKKKLVISHQISVVSFKVGGTWSDRPVRVARGPALTEVITHYKWCATYKYCASMLTQCCILH